MMLVLGLGNPILKDDAAGLRVLDLIEQALRDHELPVELKRRCIGGYDLLHEVIGFDALLVVDAFHTVEAIPGAVRFISPQELGPGATTPLSAHLLDLPSALQVGDQLGYQLPELVGAVVIEVGPECHEFGESLSPEVAAALPEAAEMALALVREHCRG